MQMVNLQRITSSLFLLSHVECGCGVAASHAICPGPLQPRLHQLAAYCGRELGKGAGAHTTKLHDFALQVISKAMAQA